MKKILKKMLKGFLILIKVMFNYVLPMLVAVLFFVLMLKNFRECVDYISAVGIINNRIMLPLGAIIIKAIGGGIYAWLTYSSIECIGKDLIEIDIKGKK